MGKLQGKEWIMTLEALPGWADEINRRRDQITVDGLNGLLGAHAVTMPLGEALARQQIDPAVLDAWVKTQLVPKGRVGGIAEHRRVDRDAPASDRGGSPRVLE